MSSTDKVRENRARRAVERRGYTLEKSRRRDPDAWDYGTYQIVDYSNGPGGQLAYADWDTGQGWGLTLDDVEGWLGQDGEQPINDQVGRNTHTMTADTEVQRAEQAERAAQIRRIAERVVPRGHWTEYGDVSQVVYGHRRGGPAIGQTMVRRADSRMRTGCWASTARSRPTGGTPMAAAGQPTAPTRCAPRGSWS